MQSDLFAMEMTVTQLTTLIKTTLEQGFYGLKVTGEVSDWRPSSSGHWFFSLKDRDSLIGCVMFKSKSWRVPFTPKNGDQVVVSGHLDVWAQRGSYQIVCDSITLAGTGNLLAQIEERKQKYNALGYFDPAHKVPLPRYPKKVGVVTSPTGAALQDVLQILGRRAPGLDVIVLPCAVQGEGAAEAIARRIQEANLLGLCDVLIVGRGGGSVEDLAPFSEDCVIQAIYDSGIPVVSGVGHEIDWAISDFVADMRAPTPSAAAELVSQGYYDLVEQVHAADNLLAASIAKHLSQAEAKLQLASQKLMRQSVERKIGEREYQLATSEESLRDAIQRLLVDKGHRLALLKGLLSQSSPLDKVRKLEVSLDGRKQLLALAIGHKVERTSSSLCAIEAQLEALSPLAVLKRGYSVVTDANGKLIAHTRDAAKGGTIDIRLQDGHLAAVVKE